MDHDDLIPSVHAFRAMAFAEGLNAVEAMHARIALSRLFRALRAHAEEVSAEGAARAAAHEREVAERRERALAAPALLILSTPIAVSVGPTDDPIHAAHRRHSVGEPAARFIRTPDGRVRAA